MSKVPAHWNRIKDAVALRDKLKSETLIFGNGDVLDLRDAFKKVQETGCDGVMVGRGIFGNPWFFADVQKIKSSPSDFIETEITPTQKLKALIEHTFLFEKTLQSVCTRI
jgi:tRNA-dihydrouridine synthase